MKTDRICMVGAEGTGLCQFQGCDEDHVADGHNCLSFWCWETERKTSVIFFADVVIIYPEKITDLLDKLLNPIRVQKVCQTQKSIAYL